MTVFFIAVLLSTGALEAGNPETPDSSRVDTVSVIGVFAGYSLGDYYHAVFLLEDGEMVTAWAPRSNLPGLDVFLFQHRWEVVEALVVDIPSYLPETGDVLLPTVIDAYSAVSYSEWYSSVSAEFGIETQQQFHEIFGDPAIEEELFNEWEYVNGPSD